MDPVAKWELNSSPFCGSKPVTGQCQVVRLRKQSLFPKETPSALRAPQPSAFPFQFSSSQVRPNHCPMWAPRGNGIQMGLCNAQPSVEVSGGLSYHFPHPPSLSCLEPRRHQSGQFINVLPSMTAWVGGHRQQREGSSGGSILGRFGGPRTRGGYQGVTDSTRALQGTEIRPCTSPGHRWQPEARRLEVPARGFAGEEDTRCQALLSYQEFPEPLGGPSRTHSGAQAPWPPGSAVDTGG